MDNQQFDAFAAEAVMPEPMDSTWFGEFIIIRGFMGTPVSGQGIVPYDSNVHKNLKYPPSICYEYQFFPMGSNFESRPQTVFKTSKEWKIFAGSLAELWGLDLSDSDDAAEMGNRLRKFTESPGYARWENVKARSYKGSDGEEKWNYGKKIIALYPTLAELQAAYDEVKGTNSTEDNVDDVPGFAPEPKKNELSIEAKLGFIAPLAHQVAENKIVDLEKLQAKINELEMLAGLDAHSTKVQDKIENLGLSILPF